jgi:hypothetical protein
VAFTWQHRYVREKDLKALTGLTPEYFRKARYSGKLVYPVVQKMGVWEGKGHKGILYHEQLLMDWLANQQDPAAHQRACEAFLQSLPSAIPAKRGPKPRAVCETA